MSFEEWVKNGWLDTHQSSREEIRNLLGIVERDLKDSQSKEVSNDWRFAIAYNAALQAATAALAGRPDTVRPETVITIGSSSLCHLRWGRAQHLSGALTHFGKSETSAHILVRNIVSGLSDSGRRLPNEKLLADAVEANVRWSMHQLMETPGGKTAVKKGAQLVGAIYEISTGRVRFLS